MSIQRRGRVQRKSMRDTYADNNKWNRFYALMGGVEVDPRSQKVIPAKREAVKTSDPFELEGAVSQEVAEVLRMHPAVIFALRQNSGATADHVSFWKWVKWRGDDPATLPDYWGLARFGLFALEAKRRNWHYTGTDRERKQKSFIDMVNAQGGRAGFVTSGAQALEILNQPSI